MTTSVRSEKILAYKRISNDTVDILAYILTGQGLRPISSAGGEFEATVVVNALDAAPHQVIAKVRQCGEHASIIIADAANAERL